MPTIINNNTLPNRMGVRSLLALPKMTSLIGRTVALRPSLASGYSRASAAAMVAILACACATRTPGFNRPTPRKIALLRSLNASFISCGSNCSAMVAGNHRSGPKIAFTPRKPGGATPITVNSTLLSRRVLPIMFGAAPKRACQVAKFITATACPPGVVSSSGKKKRPTAGLRPKVVK